MVLARLGPPDALVVAVVNAVMNQPGICCCDCGAPLAVGEPFSMRLESVGPDVMADLQEIVELICPLGMCGVS